MLSDDIVVAHVERAVHEDRYSNCQCKVCIANDIIDWALACQAEGRPVKQYYLQNMSRYLAQERSKDLNWDLEPGHCILCGGTSNNAHDQGEHYRKVRHNEQTIGGRSYSSILIHHDSAYMGIYKDYLRASGGFINYPDAIERKARFIEWACNLSDLCSAYATGIATRNHADWLEIRLAFTRLEPETYAERTEKRRHSYLAARAQGQESPVRRAESMAR